MNICPCGIAREDCDYHRSSKVTASSFMRMKWASTIHIDPSKRAAWIDDKLAKGLVTKAQADNIRDFVPSDRAHLLAWEPETGTLYEIVHDTPGWEYRDRYGSTVIPGKPVHQACTEENPAEAVLEYTEVAVWS
jgi:hypothetical protein